MTKPINYFAPVYRKKPIIFKVRKTDSYRYLVETGNCMKCAYQAAVMASATGSVGSTQIISGGRKTLYDLATDDVIRPEFDDRWAKVKKIL